MIWCYLISICIKTCSATSLVKLNWARNRSSLLSRCQWQSGSTLQARVSSPTPQAMSLNYKGVKGPTDPSRFDNLLIANSEPPIWKYEAQSVSWILLFLFSDRTGVCLHWGDMCHCEKRVQAISLIKSN